MARPRKEIDEKQFEKLCAIHCTRDEIAGFFDVSHDTLERWCKRTFKESFASSYKRLSANGNMSLRRAQFKSAIEKGNVTMQIWLGKQWLGQCEKIETVNETEQADPLSMAFKALEDGKDSVQS